jgi:hypothetical protein
MFIPQVIDNLASKKFATEFRQRCKDMLGLDPPKRIKVDLEGEYPEFVKVATEWWANAITSPTLDNKCDDILQFLAQISARDMKNYSEEDIITFKKVLADEIIKTMNEWGECRLSVDYNPCLELAAAGKLIGVNSMIGYPWKTIMNISKEKVEVAVGVASSFNTLWEKEKKN